MNEIKVGDAIKIYGVGVGNSKDGTYLVTSVELMTGDHWAAGSTAICGRRFIKSTQKFSRQSGVIAYLPSARRIEIVESPVKA